MSDKKLKLPNPWLLASIALVLIFAAFITYDKSPTFRTNINFLLGLTEKTQDEKTEPAAVEQKKFKVNLTVLTDKSVANPAYNIEEKTTQMKEDIDADLTINIVDIKDDAGKKLIADYSFKTVPVLIFDSEFAKTQFYKEVAPYFSAENGNYILKLQPITFLTIPEAGDGQAKGVTTGTPKITIIEYSSFTCPYCAQMSPVFEQALKEYPDKLKFVYKNFDRRGNDPLVENAAECAGEQGKFWEMHDYIFDNQKTLNGADAADLLKKEAETLKLDTAKFNTCVDENKFIDKINKQTDEAYSFAVSGTPGIFVNDQFIGGAIDYTNLKSVIDSFNP